MPRPRHCRMIGFRPEVVHFKPAGMPLVNLKETTLNFEELESIRLKDYENLDQKEAAKKMNISQPTFQRLLTSARKKVAEALINGNAIRIQGGNFKMVQPGKGMGRNQGRGIGYRCPASTYNII